MTKVFFIISICAALIFTSCGARENFVYGNSILVKYAKPIKSGEWIKIDDVTFYHTQADTVGQSMNPQFNNNIFHPDTLKKYADGIILPATIGWTFLPGKNKWVESIFEKGLLVSSLYSSLLETHPNSKVYKSKSNMYLMANGELLLTRSDDQKIKVSTSEGYGAYIEKKD